MIEMKTYFLTGALLMCCAATASADFSAPRGWYLEGNLGEAKVYNLNVPGKINNSGFGVNISGGVKINPYLAGEIGYTNYATTIVKNYTGQQIANVKHYSYDAAARVIMPAGATGAEFFVKVGWAGLNTNLSINNNVPLDNLTFKNSGNNNTSGIYLGAGVDYTITPHILANVQWAEARGNSSTGNLSLFSGGLSYII
jgi:opacity protein-like surface antigen